MGTPAEVGHLLQSSVSEFPLEEFMDLRRQEVTDLQTQEAGTGVKVLITLWIQPEFLLISILIVMRFGFFHFIFCIFSFHFGHCT